MSHQACLQGPAVAVSPDSGDDQNPNRPVAQMPPRWAGNPGVADVPTFPVRSSLGCMTPEEWQKLAEQLRKSIPADYIESMNRMSEATSSFMRSEVARMVESISQSITEPMLERAREIERIAASIAMPKIEALQFQIPQLPKWWDDLADLARQWQEAWEAALPPNWADLDGGNAVFEIVDHMRGSKVCLVWLPRAPILAEVIAAAPEQTKAVLLAHKDEVLDDATALLDECAKVALAQEREAVRDAIAAMRDGHHRPAQALAAAAFTSTCHVFFVSDKTKEIRGMLRNRDPDDAAIRQLRLWSICMVSAEALDSYNPTKVDGYGDFNRNISVHRITARQFTDANALAAIVLVTALLRELEEWQFAP